MIVMIKKKKKKKKTIKPNVVFFENVSLIV